MCVDAETTEYHTELDCIYTLIHIPHQVRSKASEKYHFIFKLSNDISYSIPLKVGVSILFSEQYITHHQSCSTEDKAGDDTFFNFASYGNARLFRHIRSTFSRIKEAKGVK